MLVSTNMKSRGYDVSTRAAAAQQTRERILATAVELLKARLRTDIRIEDVASGAGVSEMTVLRAFGTKQQLLQAALDAARADIVDQRQEAEPGDVRGSMTALFHHYEQLGDLVIGNLSLEA